MPNVEEIKQYYDAHVSGKIGGFVDGNERIERAWLTVSEYGLRHNTILEIGCGIGDICWRMSHMWPNAHVVGIDISPESIKIANKLFGSDRITFIHGLLTKEIVKNKFDLIILMDVYEHIALSDRIILHEVIKSILHPNARVILSFPTPRHLSWLRKNSPDTIQPVDENISVDTIFQFANDIARDVLLYKEVSVWHRGDYAHAVLGIQNEWVWESDRPQPLGLKNNIKRKIKDFFFNNSTSWIMSKEERKLFVKNKLGIDF